MSMKLDDLKLLIKNDRRIMFAAIFLIVAIFITLLTSGGGKQRRARIVPEVNPSQQGTGANEAYGDLIVAFKNDIESGKQERRELYLSLIHI